MGQTNRTPFGCGYLDPSIRRSPVGTVVNVPLSVFRQRKYAEGRQLLEAALEVQHRVLGPALITAGLLDQMRSHMRSRP